MTDPSADNQDFLLLGIIADLMSGLRHSRQTIAKKSQRSPQTADRWIRKIAATLPGAKTTREGNTTWLICEKRHDQPSKRAAVGACVAASLAPVFAGSQHQRNLRDARDYLLAVRGLSYGDLDRKFFFAAKGGDSSLPEKAGELDEVVDALLEARMLEFAYTHNNGDKEHLCVIPLSLTIFDHQFYLVAERDNRTLYAFRLARMSAANAKAVSFPYPPKIEYDPEVLFAPLFGIHLSASGPIEDVEVLLTGPWAAYALSHKWHPTQTSKPLDGGRVLVQLKVRLCPEVQTWVLGFGEFAVVQKPEALRQAIVSRVRATHDLLSPQARGKRGSGPVKAKVRTDSQSPDDRNTTAKTKRAQSR